MLKLNCASDNRAAGGWRLEAGSNCFGLQPRAFSLQRAGVVVCTVALAGCATPQYAVRGTPVPDESASAVQIERAISAQQAKEFQRQDARAIGLSEELWGFRVQEIVSRLSRVTERSYLTYRAYLYQDKDPNAAALADGRIYLSTGLLNYLGERGSRPDEPLDSSSTRSGRMPSEVEAELAFIIGHELAHTVAQHLVKRYHTLQQQQLLVSLVAAGASVATRNASAGGQRAGQFAVNAATLLRDVALSGYSQEQELEADQLGLRYMQRAGFDPSATLELLEDFARFDRPTLFLRTHPYTSRRREDVQRYLSELQQSPPSSGGIRQLQETQKLYPRGSVSWKNLQDQIEELD